MTEHLSSDEHKRHSRFHFHWRIGRDVSLVILTTFAAVGAVIGASTGIAALRQVDRIAETQTAMFEGTSEETARAADSNPDNAHLTLVSPDRQSYVDGVIGASEAEGWLIRSNLPALDEGRSYQVWARTNDQVLPLGYAGRNVGAIYFSFPTETKSIFLTEEADTGTLQPTGDAVAAADLP